jgi:putative transposase
VAAGRDIEPAFIDPVKPRQTGADESFAGKFRDQHLSLVWFRNRTEAKVSIEQCTNITTKSGRIRVSAT